MRKQAMPVRWNLRGAVKCRARLVTINKTSRSPRDSRRWMMPSIRGRAACEIVIGACVQAIERCALCEMLIALARMARDDVVIGAPGLQKEVAR